MSKFRFARVRVWLGLLLLAAVLSGCQSLGYYKQAAQGQFQIWSRQKPITELIGSAQTPAPLQARLKLLLEMRQFAERELKLPVNGHYEKYADLGRRFVVWNVNAAPELSLEPKRWWYPFLGRLKYRGYFSERYARDYGAKLAQDHYDVYVGGVEAYSTLGWFRDPVLNTWANHDEADVAEILFHELAHQRVFAHGDTDFNEAFATAVSEEAVRRWFVAKGNTNDYQHYLTTLQRNTQFVHLVMDARSELKAVYGEQAPEDDPDQARPNLELSDALKRQEKTRIISQLKAQYQQLKSQWNGDTDYDRWFAKPINNAQINTVATYYRLVPAFQKLLQQNSSDLERFYKAAEKLTKLSKAERNQQLDQLLPHPKTQGNLAINPPR